MLEKVGQYNDLSPELRKIIEDKVLSFGKVVRFKFDIANENPDPEKKQGQWLWPFLWTLDPVTFNIIDKNETREGKQKVKKIGIVEEANNEKFPGEPSKFRRIRVPERNRGVMSFDLTTIEGQDDVAYLLIHPKLDGGMFSDDSKRKLITLIDEKAAATQQRAERTARKLAMDIAEEMSDKDVIAFADAMSGGNNVEWDSTQDVDVLRNKIEALAENNPEYFNDKVAGKSVEYQALIKQAMNKKIITFDPAEYKFIWEGNKQIISVLSPVGEKNEIEKFAEILQTGGIKMEETYKKIKSLVE